jgi:hypothetical protein
MLQAAHATSAAFVSSSDSKTPAQDASFAMVLAVSAFGLALSLVASAINPDWLFALTM